MHWEKRGWPAFKVLSLLSGPRTLRQVNSHHSAFLRELCLSWKDTLAISQPAPPHPHYIDKAPQTSPISGLVPPNCPPGICPTMADDQEKDLQKFLKNVDEITTLIQELNSDDPVIQQKAVHQTEKRLMLMEEAQEEDECRTTLNKTMISPPQAANADELKPEAFLASVEKDAKERAKRRRENKVLADALKEQGNKAFAKGDYETAILHYNEGLDKMKDMKVLYTNRAQAYIKLGDYQKALVDCDWALKCDEKCTKAYFHMGKAHLALKNYSMSRQCYQKISEINSKLQTQVKEYLHQVDLQEKADFQEKEAHELLDLGKNTAVTTKNLLETLSKPDQTPLFYAGGMEILTDVMKDCTEQTLFRTHNGFSIISDNEVIRRCLSIAEKDMIEETVCVTVLKLWQAVCSENEENQRLLVLHPNIVRLLPSLLTSKVMAIQQQSLALLLQVTQTEHGRSLVISHLDMTRCRLLPGLLAEFLFGYTGSCKTTHSQVSMDFCRLLEALLSFLDFSDKKASTAIGLLTDLALEERFQVWFQANLPDALFAFTGVLKRDPMVTNSSALCRCIAIMGNLSAEPATRRHMLACDEFRDACLGLLRAAGVLSRTLSSSQKIIKEAVRAGVVKKMIKFLKTGGQTASHYAIKILAVCTNSYCEAREEVIRLDKKFSVLLKLLTSEDEILMGNAALCLGNCMEVPNVASSLLKTDVVQVLLKLAGGDSRETAVQLNAGIALGKLCTAEPRAPPCHSNFPFLPRVMGLMFPAGFCLEGDGSEAWHL
ncbi:tetratricopeptide repeat protein 12 isoform X11 [Heterocephalus glaber]|uniref:Tetratricopeptide repeat protein 12 n=1 Tax=Heterocephalus glaber TaxID=10181 RepID=A0AAX6RDJ6_HETGA|nr:tetratricopeptide repeat protein 12 isoform X11 [Heterocephalus glaber]